ncbi:MAG: hypothetical protein Q9201_001470 [Fulgogasparrea decipioides]
METILPGAITTAYARYKAYESSVLSWIVTASNECGYRKPPQVVCPIKADGNPGTILPEKGDSENYNNVHHASATTAKPVKKPVKYAVTREEMVERVELIVGREGRKAIVPDFVVRYLRRSIADREKCSAWFNEHMAGDSLVEQSTSGHIHFTEILKSIQSRLEPYVGSREASPPKRTRKKRAQVDLGKGTESKPGFANLHVTDLGEDDSDELLSVDDLSNHKLPEVYQQPDIQEVYEAESTNEDVLVAISGILGKLKSVRKHIKSVWREYRKQQISLIQATVVTNTAIDYARILEDDFIAEFSNSPAWGEGLVETLFPRETSLWKKNLSTFTLDDSQDIDRLYQLPTTFLKTFLDTCEKRALFPAIKDWIPQINRVYDPRQDISNSDYLGKLNRNKILLDSIIPELAMQAKSEIFSSSDQVTAAFRETLETKNVRLLAAFAIQVLLDMNIVLGNDFSRPFCDVRIQANRYRQEIDDYIKKSDNPILDREIAQGVTVREFLDKPLTFTDGPAIRDEMMVFRRKLFEKIDGFDYVVRAQKPYFLLTHHPLLSGSLTISTCTWKQEMGSNTADQTRYATAVLHLHSALRQEQCLSAPQRYLQSLEKVYGPERIFLGRPPTNPNAYLNHYLVVLGVSIKTFAANNNRRKEGKRIMNAATSRPRDLREMPPLLQLLEKQFKWGCERYEPKLPEIMALLAARDPSARKQPPQEFGADPIGALTAYGNCIKDEQYWLDFNFYQAHHVCWKLLRRVEASPAIQKKFRRLYDVTDKNVDENLHYVTLFIFEQYLHDSSDRTFMKSVAETVEKFFREFPPEQLKNWQDQEMTLDDPTDIAYATEWEIPEPWHPTRNRRCYHVGLCELQIIEWRQQAGLAITRKSDDRASEDPPMSAKKTRKRKSKARRSRDMAERSENDKNLTEGSTTIVGASPGIQNMPSQQEIDAAVKATAKAYQASLEKTSVQNPDIDNKSAAMHENASFQNNKGEAEYVTSEDDKVGNQVFSDTGSESFYTAEEGSESGSKA